MHQYNKMISSNYNLMYSPDADLKLDLHSLSPGLWAAYRMKVKRKNQYNFTLFHSLKAFPLFQLLSSVFLKINPYSASYIWIFMLLMPNHPSSPVPPHASTVSTFCVFAVRVRFPVSAALSHLHIVLLHPPPN